MKKEVIFGILWGLTLGLLFIALMYSVTSAAVINDVSSDIDISISGDSVRVDLTKNGNLKTVVINSDSVTRTQTGITVDSELLIENGRIFVDGVELNQDELRRLSVSQDEESGIQVKHNDGTHRQIKRKRLATVYADSGDDIFKFDNLEIDSAEIVSGDVVSISGDITVRGEVSGDIVSVFGDIYLKDGAQVSGDVAAPLGQVYRDPNVIVKGEVAGRKKRLEKKKEASFGMTARFNRVEGFTMIPDMTFNDKKEKLPTVDLSGAYAFTLKRWEYDFRVRHKIGKALGPQFGADFYQWASTSDSWRFSEIENTIAGLFFKEDFCDYYWNRGFTGDAGIFAGKELTSSIVFTASRISNLKKTAEKAIFGGHKVFRQNWSTILPDSADIAASVGDLNELGWLTTYDSRDDKEEPHSGLLAFLDLRQSLASSSDNFDYKMASGAIEGYIPLARSQTLMVRGRAGYSDDFLPLFRRFFLGGVGSLRGYDYKEFAGNRYLLFNADYIWRFYRSDFGAGVFFDAGKAASSERQFKSGGLKTDIGIAFLIEDAFRIDLAQRLDDLDKSPIVMGRLQMAF